MGLFDRLRAPAPGPTPTPADTSLAVTAQLGAVGVPPLTSTDPATLRRRITNDLQNPRGNPLSNGWTHSDAGGSSIAWALVTNDPDLGYCAQYTGTWAAAAQPTITIGTPIKTWGAPVRPGQVFLARASVKMTAAGTSADCPVTLAAVVTQNDGSTSVSSRVVRTAPRMLLGAPVVLEGIEYGQASAAWVQLLVTLQVPAAGTWAFRVGQPQIMVDPDGQVGAYIDGSLWNGSWQSTADASGSEGWVDPPTLPTPFYIGFNDNVRTHGSTSGTSVLSAAQNAALYRELGRSGRGTPMWRGGVNPGNAWPTSGGAPNWHNHELASLFDALRAVGGKACPIIGNCTTWLTTDSSGFITSLDPTKHAAWKQLYTSLVMTWPDVITAVEFYNEPNLSATWNPPNAANYTALMAEMYTAIKAARPDLTFLGGALNQYATNDATGVPPGTFLASMYAAGAKTAMDAISVHPYPADQSTAVPAGGAVGALSGFDLTLNNIRAQKHANNDDAKPIWITEVGPAKWSASPERQIAVFMNVLTGICQRAGDIQACLMHTLHSDTTTAANQQWWEAVEYKTLRRKPVFTALGSGIVPDLQDSGWVPADQGLLLANYDPALAATQLTMASGFIILVRIPVRKTVTVSNFMIEVGVAGSGLTAGDNLLGLYLPAGGPPVAYSADQTAAWASAGEKVAAMNAPVTLQGGPRRWVWGAFLCVGTTTPKMQGLGSGQPNSALNTAALFPSETVPGASARAGYESAGSRTSLVSLSGLALQIAYSNVPWMGLY